MRLTSLFLSVLMTLSCAACTRAENPSAAPPVQAGERGTLILLSDDGVTVDGAAASTSPESAVYVGGDIIYYADGTDDSYGEGTEAEKHSAQEAGAHTVVTITQPGVYRLSGSLSRGQVFVDLGEDARTDPEAVVTLILNGADITCTVAPAVFFYNVYECDTQWVAYDEDDAEYTPGYDVDTSAAGANVVLAAGSVNNISGSHVARIYKEGTTKKLHKYDGAFYSRMSMNIDGDNGDDSGVLNITADNEGLDSELHLTINGGTISITAQNDGINTNEDGVSVTTINGGSLTVNAGLGAEGDGIDSNGWLVLNGGTVWTMANETTPDCGIDADQPILLNGGTVAAFGTRNDAADSGSAQPYLELSFASTLPAGSAVRLTDADGREVWSGVTQKRCQSITLTTPGLALDTVYHVYVDGVLQCYSSTGSAGFRGGMGGGKPTGGMEPPEGFLRPEGQEGQRPQKPEGGDFDPGQRGERPEGMEPPEGFQGGRPGMDGVQTSDGSGSTDFILTAENKSFSGVCDSDESGKTRISFSVEGPVRSGQGTVIEAITAITPDKDIDPSLVQITVADDPSEDYSASCLLSDGLEAVNGLLPGEEGRYTLTVAVVSGSADYTGATQISFTAVGE